MEGTFSTIVVPLDLEVDSEFHAVGVANVLASIASLPIELVTVTTGPREEPEKASLHRSASDHQIERWTNVVLHDEDTARALAEHLSTLVAPLVVMASKVHGPLGEVLALSTSANLLSQVNCPVLILGPHVESDWSPSLPRLLACVGSFTNAEATIPVIVRWLNTFGGEAPWFVEVVEPASDGSNVSDVAETGLVRNVADRLAEQGIKSEWEVLHDKDPVDALRRFASSVYGAVLVVASERWADPARTHLHSVSRHLAHRSTDPVLVAPSANVSAAE